MLPLLIAAGAGLVRAGVGIAQAKRESNRQKGIIGKAYQLGQERMNLRQGDTRESVAENTAQRGLTQGGDVTTPTYGSTPQLQTSVGGAHTLGGQQMADLAREQNLESYSMQQDKERALSDTKAAFSGNVVSSIAAGINTAAGVAGMGNAMGDMKSPAQSTGGVGAGVQAESPPPGWTPSAYPGAFKGIDPLNPVGQKVASTGDFNKYSGANLG